MRRQIAFLVLLPAALAGCMQMSYVVRLNEDGSGRVTEVVKFGPKVVRLEKKLPKGEGTRLADLLSEGRVKERAKLMGEGVTVAIWKVEETIDGGVRLTAVYSFKDINDLALCMVGPAVDLVDAEKMTPEELERLRGQFLKDRKPEAICKRIEENEAIPPPVRELLIATLRGGELDKKYEMLLSAYFLELARQGK